MANQFGALTDHFGLTTAGTGILDGVAVLVESSSVPVAKSVVRAEDSLGDNAAEEATGQTAAGTLAEISCTYAVTKASFNLNKLFLGEVSAGLIRSGLDVKTGNGEWPTITVKGMSGCIAVVYPSGIFGTFQILDDVTILNAKVAQLFDFTVDAACRITGSSFGASINVASTANGVGTIVAHGISGGVVTQSCELVAISGVAEWTPGVSWKQTQKPGASQPQAGWHTASGAAEKLLARDVTTTTATTHTTTATTTTAW
jgi:hypothetical protein